MNGRIVPAAIMALALAGCTGEQAELKAWMQEVRSSTPVAREKIEEPKRFRPFRYDQAERVDPFSAGKMAVAAEGSGRPGASNLRPDLNRRREALESYPLDTIQMVGYLASGRQNHALLKADATVYQARVGNHAGQNFGVITRITEREVLLRELVQDAAGDWVHRESALRLQEGSTQ